MATYKDLQAQIAQLQTEAQKARNEEVRTAIAQIQSLMNEFGITAADLKSRTSKKGNQIQGKTEIKFRDGENTWSGAVACLAGIKGKTRKNTVSAEG